MFDCFWVRAITWGPSDCNVNPGLGAAYQEAVADIVSVAHVGYFQAFQSFLVLGKCQQVRQNLARVLVARQTVGDGRLRTLSENDKVVTRVDTCRYGGDVGALD